MGSELYLFQLRTEKFLGDTFSEEVELLLPRQMANTWSNQWPCSRTLQHHPGLLQPAWRAELSSQNSHMLRAVFLACGHTCQDTVAKKDVVLLFENLHMLNAYIVQFNVTTAFFCFFPFMPDSWYSYNLFVVSTTWNKRKLWKTLTLKAKQNALTGFFFS